MAGMDSRFTSAVTQPPDTGKRSRRVQAELRDGVRWMFDMDDQHRSLASEPLVDSFGRVADDLRISVTDRCNFRCTYCMPAEGLQWLPKSEILTFEELTRLVEVLARIGVDEVRLTGGEPLVRRELPELVRMLAATPGVEDLSLTTNGILLERF